MTPTPGNMEHTTFHHQTWDRIARIAAFSDVPPKEQAGTLGIPLGTIAVAPARSASVTGEQVTLLLRLYPQQGDGAVHYVAKGADQYGLFQPDGEHLTFLVTTDETHSVTVPVPEDWYETWHTVAAIYTGTAIQLVIDGSEVGTTPVSGCLRYAPGALLFGRHPFEPGNGRGVLHQFQLYDEALTPSALENALVAPPAECRINFAFDTWDSFTGVVTAPPAPHGSTPSPQWQEALMAWQATTAELNQASLSCQVPPDVPWDKSTADWEIWRDGEVVQSGTCAVEWDQDARRVSLQPGYALPPAQAGTEHWLNLYFQRDAVPVACKQFLLPTDTAPAPGPVANSLASIDIHEKDNVGYFKGANFTLEIDLPTATIISWEIDGEQLLELGPIHQLWRAPTHTELGGNDALATRWSVAGFAENMMGVTAMEALQDMPSRVTMQFKGLIIRRDSEILFEVARDYIVHGDGEVVLRQTLTPKMALPPLGRIGLEIRLPNDMTQVSWYGRGPEGLFDDSRAWDRVALYDCREMPSWSSSGWPTEQGHKRDVRWLTLRNAGGRGLFIGSHVPFGATVSPYSTFQITEALHGDCLTPDSAITVHVDSQFPGPDTTATPLDSPIFTELRMRGLLPEDEAPGNFLKRGIPEVDGAAND